MYHRLVGGRLEFDPSESFDGGVAVIVATVGDDRRPALTRGWGPSYDASTRTLTRASRDLASRRVAHKRRVAEQRFVRPVTMAYPQLVRLLAVPRQGLLGTGDLET